MVKTEYSTFTYFITSLEDGQTVTSTDIVVSSNVVTSLPSIEATPLLQDVASDQVSERLDRLETVRVARGGIGTGGWAVVGFIPGLTSAAT